MCYNHLICSKSDQSGNQKNCPCGSTDADCALALNWPQNDAYLNQTCMNFTRSSPAFPTSNCSIRKRSSSSSSSDQT